MAYIFPSIVIKANYYLLRLICKVGVWTVRSDSNRWFKISQCGMLITHRLSRNKGLILRWNWQTKLWPLTLTVKSSSSFWTILQVRHLVVDPRFFFIFFFESWLVGQFYCEGHLKEFHARIIFFSSFIGTLSICSSGFVK